MPRKFEVEQERDELRAKLQEAHSILSEALGFDEDDELEEEEDEAEEDGEDED